MYTQHTDKELLNMIREIMKEVRKRRLSAQEKAAVIIWGLEPEEITQEQEAAAAEAIEAVHKEQMKEIRASARKKEERLQRESKAQRKQIANWVKKQKIAQDIQAILGKGWSLNVWDGSDKRVYLDGEGRSKICCYITGNRRNPPGHLTLERVKLEPADKEALQRICNQAAEQWRETKFDIDVAANWKPPRPIGVGEHDIEIEVA